MRAVEILIQGIDDCHIFFFDSKIENVPVGTDTVRVYRFWDYGNTFLDGPTQPDLGRRPGVFGGQHAHHIIVEISTSCQRCIGLNLNAVCLAVFDQLSGIAKWMAFNLVYRRNDAGYFF